MTVIAGYDDGARVALGADTMETMGDRKTFGCRKLVKVGPCWVGCSGHALWTRFLRDQAAKPPGILGSKSPYWGPQFCEALADAWLAWAKERGHGEQHGGIWQLNGSLLAATPAGLYSIDACGNVQRREMFAIGIGCEAALGAMWVEKVRADTSVRKGVSAAIALIAGCGGDVVVETVERSSDQDGS